MHFLTSLIIFSGFMFVLCFGLLKVIWDLSQLSVHSAPDVPATSCQGLGAAGAPRANAQGSSAAAELSDAQ
jgi:hypothetical protein